MNTVRPEYPRPQVVRNDWKSLNGEWNFAFDDDNVGLKQKWYKIFPSNEKKITVPFAYQTEKSGINDPSFHDVVWYNTTFEV
ncbi:hypothetical protein AB685_28980, partial [Bacillus sp. LL01]|uniref:sugar-binding domain-containing protein n=1 Tax=Bacillus sp. LL01 TaxID=1665556 RepID=UPI00064CE5C5